MTDSIFASAARVRTPSSQDPRGHESAFAAPARPARRASAPPTASDASLIAIIEAPLQSGETASCGFARKEAELREAFAALSILESRALHSRLWNPRSGDRLAAAFMRMTAERRARLINFLADARRREALRSSGR
jgi:hypothetical protein